MNTSSDTPSAPAGRPHDAQQAGRFGTAAAGPPFGPTSAPSAATSRTAAGDLTGLRRPVVLASASLLLGITATVAVVAGQVGHDDVRLAAPAAPFGPGADVAGAMAGVASDGLGAASYELPASLDAGTPDALVTPALSRPFGSIGSVDALEIDTRALVAYQRAAVVMDDAAPRCGLTWPLIAAVGRVESDHGTVDGGRLGAENGVVRPALIGEAHNGRGGRPAESDTDMGELDGDERWDRPVGPMRFTPEQWSRVGVDGDADGKRDPQDMDDAALATAIALCAPRGDLSDDADRLAAVRNLNPAPGYAAAVLRAADEYERTDVVTAAAPTPILNPTADPTAPIPLPVRPTTVTLTGTGPSGSVRGAVRELLAGARSWLGLTFGGTGLETTRPARDTAPDPETELDPDDMGAGTGAGGGKGGDAGDLGGVGIDGPAEPTDGEAPVEDGSEPADTTPGDADAKPEQPGTVAEECVTEPALDPDAPAESAGSAGSAGEDAADPAEPVDDEDQVLVDTDGHGICDEPSDSAGQDEPSGDTDTPDATQRRTR